MKHSAPAIAVKAKAKWRIPVSLSNVATLQSPCRGVNGLDGRASEGAMDADITLRMESSNVDSDDDVGSTFEAAMSGLERLNIIGELMDALALVTMGGRVHVMQKVLKILRAEILLPNLPLTDAQFNLVKNALNVADRETARIAPLQSVFAERVRTVVDAVRGAWSKRIATSGCSDGQHAIAPARTTRL